MKETETKTQTAASSWVAVFSPDVTGAVVLPRTMMAWLVSIGRSFMILAAIPKSLSIPGLITPEGNSKDHIETGLIASKGARSFTLGLIWDGTKLINP
jgi:hypothetical protein